MKTNTEVISDQLQQLRQQFVETLPSKIDSLKQAWDSFLQTEKYEEDRFALLYRQTHNLAGSGKTLGFPELSELAHTLQQQLQQLGSKMEQPSEEEQALIQHIIDGLQQLVLDLCHETDAQQEDLPNVRKLPQTAADTDNIRRIYLVEDDITQAEALKMQLGYFGYQVTLFHTIADFEQAMQHQPDVLVLMDISFPEGEMAGIHAVQKLQEDRIQPVPVVFVTSWNSFEIRLEATRAGGVCYLNKPVSISTLVDKLDQLTESKPQIPYRVLIVDDLAELASYYASVIQQAGLLVQVVTDPYQVLEQLTEFAPDLILVDLYMPSCNGIELAQVIRQVDQFTRIPIVFLSGETNVDKQLDALSMGGDDFLTKPIEAEHLISSISSRIKRSRALHSLMISDGLTGLLNHVTIKERLKQEVDRAKRMQYPLTFVMLDIDHFKQVNDRYGHGAGDRVIKSLARLLKQRLRTSDLIGRYGGEEFALVMINTDNQYASTVLESILRDFEKLSHFSDDKIFSVSFSAGVCDLLTAKGSASQLTELADQALYQSKKTGRNRVTVAEAPFE